MQGHIRDHIANRKGSAEITEYLIEIVNAYLNEGPSVGVLIEAI
jgi:hypothetical protein